MTEVDIRKALREESPYLLFYQVQPIDEELAMRGDPPTYQDASNGIPSVDLSKETLASTVATDTEGSGESEKASKYEVITGSARPDEPISRISFSSNRRSSIAIDDTEGSLRSASRGRTEPPTPDDQRAGFLSVSRRGSRIWPGGNKSRPTSPSGEHRLSLTLSRLTGRGSKDKLNITENDPVIVVDEVQTADSSQAVSSPTLEKKDAGLSRSKSKKEKKERLRSKSRDPLESGGEKGKHKEKRRPDRECAVM